MSDERTSELAVLESHSLELHKLQNWFALEGALALGWDAKEARSINAAVNMQEASLLKEWHDPDNYKMRKPDIIRDAEEFFMQAKMAAESEHGKMEHADLHLHTPAEIEGQKAQVEAMYQRLMSTLEQLHPEVVAFSDTLKKNIEAARRILHSEQSMTVEEAGGDLQHYVYQDSVSHEHEESHPEHHANDEVKPKGGFVARVKSKITAPKVSSSEIGFTVNWPALPDSLPNEAVERVVEARQMLIHQEEEMHRRFHWGHAKADRKELSYIRHLIAEALMHGGKGLPLYDAHDLAKKHVEAVEHAVAKLLHKLPNKPETTATSIASDHASPAVAIERKTGEPGYDMPKDAHEWTTKMRMKHDYEDNVIFSRN